MNSTGDTSAARAHRTGALRTLSSAEPDDDKVQRAALTLSQPFALPDRQLGRDPVHANGDPQDRHWTPALPPHVEVRRR